MENYFATGSLAGVLSFLYRLVPGLIFNWVTDISENPLDSSNPNPRSFPQIKQYSRRKKGRRGLPAARLLRWGGRGCRGGPEGHGDVRVTVEDVGVDRSACVGGGARRLRGVRPIQGRIDQSNGSESFTRDQGRGVREELKNGSPECPVHARGRVTEVRRRWSRASGEVLPGRGLGKLHGPMAKLTEALAQLGRDWRELATAAEALKAWRAVARRARGNFRWSLTWARLESTRGWMAEAWGGFIGTTRCTGGRGPVSARGRALGGAGARTGVNRGCQPRSNTCARCLCPSSSADWVQIFANLGKIAVKDLFTWPCFVFCVWTPRGFRLGTWSCSVTKVPVSECLVPRSNCAKTVSNEFGSSSNFSRACSREFGTTLIFGSPGSEFRKIENAVDPWKEV
jgi:hypothetical protein